MLIEFVGFSSSGKTSLIHKILSEHANKIKFVELDFNKKPYVIEWETTFFLLITDIKIILKEIIFDMKSMGIFFLLIKDVINQGTSIRRKSSLIRAIMRKYFLSKKYASQSTDKVFLFDEGIVQSCVNIAVTSSDFNLELQNQAKFIIDSVKPDLVIYLKPLNDQLMQRISGRKDRGHWGSASSHHLVIYVQKFDEMVRKLYTHDLLIINNSDVGRILKAINEYTFNKRNYNAQP